MKRLIVCLITLMLSRIAYADPVGNPFLRGVHSPAELASKIESVLARDETGHVIIDPERCKRDGSCASPVDYLTMFRASDNEAPLRGVGDLPAFLRSLKRGPAPSGEYWMACIKEKRPVLHCLSRQFKRGEEAWSDPKTGRIVLAQSCTNPVEKANDARCAEVRFTTRKGDTAVRFALLCPNTIVDDCLGVKKAGDDEWQRWWKDQCADESCSFERASMVVGAPVRAAGSYALTPGEHVLRVPAMVAQQNSPCRVVLCLDRDGMHSDGVGVQWFDYQSRDRVPKATVWYDKHATPARASSTLTWTWGEW